jgi:TalC/MipB family fructose-6-phosphate aldolase
MQIWLAFTGFEEMEKAHAYPIQGVLTNPTLVSKPGIPWREAVSRMNEIGTLPLGLQVVSTRKQTMIEEIKAFHGLIDKKKLIIKLPFCLDAMGVVPFIKRLGHAVNMAAVCTFPQGVLALETDIEYLSIYVGRVSDGGGNGIELVERLKSYALSAGKRTLIQAASIRTLQQFEEAALAGADAVVISFSLLEEAAKSPLTDESIAKFTGDWARIS